MKLSILAVAVSSGKDIANKLNVFPCTLFYLALICNSQKHEEFIDCPRELNVSFNMSFRHSIKSKCKNGDKQYTLIVYNHVHNIYWDINLVRLCLDSLLATILSVIFVLHRFEIPALVCNFYRDLKFLCPYLKSLSRFVIFLPRFEIHHTAPICNPSRPDLLFVKFASIFNSLIALFCNPWNIC